jgi:multiple sugar transport system substrate-binding protein
MSTPTRKYPNAAREYLRFMWEKPQVDYWETALERLCRAAVAGMERQPGVDRRPEGHAVPRRAEIRSLDNGYSGALGAPRRR